MDDHLFQEHEALGRLRLQARCGRAARHGKTEHDANPVETFTIGFADLKDDSATITLDWDKTHVPVEIDDEHDGESEGGNRGGLEESGRAQAGILLPGRQLLLRSRQGSRAGCEVDRQGDREAKEPRYFMYYKKAQIEAKLGHKDQAKAAAEKSIELLKAETNPDETAIRNSQMIIDSLKLASRQVVRLLRPCFRTRVAWLLLAFVSLASAVVAAAAPREMDSAQIRLALEKLNVLGRVLYVAAHPDDENTGLIAYWANGALYDAAYLSLTRGDGGQNLIGPELREQLGVIRTQELLAARRIDHGRQFFTRANDFGFSKSAEETLRIWDRDKILADVVWVMRKFRPDLVVTRFPTEDSDTHGHHTASARLAAEAFARRAIRSVFPSNSNSLGRGSRRDLLWNSWAAFRARETSRALEYRIDPAGSGRLSAAPRQILSRDRRGQPEHAQEPGLWRRSSSAASARNISSFSTATRSRKAAAFSAGSTRPGRACRRARNERRRSTISCKDFDDDAPWKSVPALLELRKKLRATWR